MQSYLLAIYGLRKREQNRYPQLTRRGTASISTQNNIGKQSGPNAQSSVSVISGPSTMHDITTSQSFLFCPSKPKGYWDVNLILCQSFWFFFTVPDISQSLFGEFVLRKCSRMNQKGRNEYRLEVLAVQTKDVMQGCILTPSLYKKRGNL